MIVYHWNRGPPRTAGAGRRAAAFAIDAGLVFALTCGLVFVGAAAGAISVPDAPWPGMQSRFMGLLWTVGLLELPLLLTYSTLFEGLGGRTPGKMLLGLRVARLEGGPNDLFHGFLRNLLRLLWVTPLAPLFVLLDLWSLGATELDQRMGDLAAGTVVLDERAAF